jgi:UDP-4-amino-4,6-dideoxy-N-acetyl-beta-L-altrosamine N-acetyltransferase
MLNNQDPFRIPWESLVLGPVCLRPVIYQDIEKVRNWRNDPEVAQFMVFRGSITKGQQDDWFRRIQNEKGFYAIIVIEGEDVGLADLKNFSADGKSAEGGIFVHAKAFQNSIYGYAVCTLLLDCAFECLNLEMVEATILDTNIRAIRFNKSLGYMLNKNKSTPGVGKYYLTADTYRKKVGIIRRSLMISLGRNC